MPLSLFLMLIPGLQCFLCALCHSSVSLENLFQPDFIVGRPGPPTSLHNSFSFPRFALQRRRVLATPRVAVDSCCIVYIARSVPQDCRHLTSLLCCFRSLRERLAALARCARGLQVACEPLRIEVQRQNFLKRCVRAWLLWSCCVLVSVLFALEPKYL